MLLSMQRATGYENAVRNSFFSDSQFVPEQAINENSKVGWLFSSKAIVQLLANPIIGPVTNRLVVNY